MRSISRRSPPSGLVTALALFGTALSGSWSPALRAQETAVEAEVQAQMVFKDGEAQVVEAFNNPRSWIREDLFVETTFDSDGDGKMDRVHVSLFRPEQTKTEGLKVHVIYETSPYYAGTAGNEPGTFWDPKHELGAEPPARKNPTPIQQQKRRPSISASHVRQWLPRGFAVVHSESPGTGMSQGCPTVGGVNEELAPKAVIDWLNGRAKGYTELEGGEEVVASWATGKVGMIGTSYNGTLPLAAATTGVEGLEAIVPIAPNTSYYHYYRSHGLVRHPGGYMGEDIDVLYDFIHSGDPAKRPYCNETVRDGEMASNMDRLTGDYSDWWEARNYRERLGGVKAAVLMAHAFNDWNVMPEHSVEVYAKLKELGVPSMAFFHQGGHGGPPPMSMVNRWFTRYVCGVENDVENDPRSWVVREGDPRNRPTSYADYPNPAAKPVTFKLGMGGKSQGVLAMDAKASGTESFLDDVGISGAQLASLEKSDNRLLYVTPKLKAPLHFSGTGRIQIRMAADKTAANLSVWLVSLPMTGNRRRVYEDIVTRGWADPQNRGSLTESSPLVPGEFVEFGFDLQPDDQILPVGAQLGLMIFSSDRDFTLWPEAGTELTVDLEKTMLTLPVVGGAEAVKAALGN